MDLLSTQENSARRQIELLKNAKDEFYMIEPYINKQNKEMFDIYKFGDLDMLKRFYEAKNGKVRWNG